MDKIKEDNSFKTAYFAAGCFWGMQYQFAKASGVVATVAGFMGGHVDHPSYVQVKQGDSGHLETIRVDYDPSKTSYDKLLKLYFEIHDFTQTDGQGPDIGSQYLSAIFYNDESERCQAEQIIELLKAKGYLVATQLRPASVFWPAEDYHQYYYEKRGGVPYCHVRRKIFD